MELWQFRAQLSAESFLAIGEDLLVFLYHSDIDILA